MATHLQRLAFGVGGGRTGAAVAVQFRVEGGYLGLRLVHLHVEVGHVGQQAEVGVLDGRQPRQQRLCAVRACPPRVEWSACV